MTNQKVLRGATSLMDLTYSYARGDSKGSIDGTIGNLMKMVDNLNRNKNGVYEYDSLEGLAAAKGGAPSKRRHGLRLHRKSVLQFGV